MMDTSGGKLSQLPCSLGEKLGGMFYLVFLRSSWKPVPIAHSSNLLINRPGIVFQVFHVSLPSLPSIQRNTQQIKEQDKCPPNQTKEEKIGNLPDKEFQLMIGKMNQNLEKKK